MLVICQVFTNSPPWHKLAPLIHLCLPQGRGWGIPGDSVSSVTWSLHWSHDQAAITWHTFSPSWSHHTNSFEHIIIKFKNKKVSFFKMWLFAAASVVNITDISFFYQFESILWWFGVAKASKWWKTDPTGSPCADCNKALLKNKVNFFGGRSGESGARGYYGLK